MQRIFYAALDEQIPDLVLLDIMLPDENGHSDFEKTFDLNHKTSIGAGDHGNCKNNGAGQGKRSGSWC